MQHLVRGSTPVVPLVLLLTVGQYSTEWQAVSEGHVVRQEWPPLKRGSTAAFKASVHLPLPRIALSSTFLSSMPACKPSSSMAAKPTL